MLLIYEIDTTNKKTKCATEGKNDEQKTWGLRSEY